MAGKTHKARPPSPEPDKDARALERATALMRKDASLSKSAALRQAGITETRELRRLTSLLKPSAKAKKVPTAPKATAAGRKSPRRTTEAAAPLLASSPKKVGALSKAPGAAKTTKDASYQPKTELPPLHQATTPALPGAPDVFALARPWMTLGLQMTAASLAMQARMAKAALEMPPAATALRQGSAAFGAWLALAQPRRRPKD